MGNLKDTVDLGVEAIQFWMRFKGRRVRVWPTEVTLLVCSEAFRWVTTPRDSTPPPWWEMSPAREAAPEEKLLATYAAEHLTAPNVPHLETVENARLFDATIADVIRNPAGLYLTGIEYWLVVGTDSDRHVVKQRSADEGMLLPLGKLARIDFVNPDTRAATPSAWD